MFHVNYGKRVGIRKVAILITDGLSNIDKPRTIPEARLAKEDGVRIYSIGITDYADGAELEVRRITLPVINAGYLLSLGDDDVVQVS